MKLLLYTILVLSAAALAASITTDDGSAAKRTVDLLRTHTHAQSRRIQGGPAPAQNHYQQQQQAVHRRRPSLPLPPYAVQMEPLVQYSQRDPLYHQQQLRPDNLTSHNSIDEKVLRVDFDPEGSQLSESYGPPDHYQQYYREPEPIIEIIIKESNETLPAPPPPPPTHPVKPTKEPVHVFYVKYKKNPKGKGEDDIIYEAPVPAITPPTDELDEESYPAHSVDTQYEAASLPPPPSTTLRTVIHPDSEVYHGSGLKVTFGETEVKSPDAAYGESNAPEPSVALPHKEAQNRESSVATNMQAIKRQGVYQTIPQEVYDQNPPKAAASTSVPNFQTNTFNQQSLQNPQFQQQKAAFARQAQPPPSFRPQHTAAIFNNQPTQQFHQRQPFQQQQQNNPVQQRQVPRQQNNLYSTNQTPPQNHQQVPQRPPPQQFDQRPQYSQPLNNPSQPLRQQQYQPQDQQHLRHQQLAHQQQIAHQQQQTAQNQLRNQPIHVPNQDFSRYNQQVFPTAQPVNTAAPLPSKPIHPQFAQHYQQQIAQQQRQNFIPSTHQPQQVNPSQPPTNQQQYRFPQQVVNIPRQPSTSQPLQPFHYSTPAPTKDLSFRTPLPSVLPNLSGAEVIKAIPQSEEHLQPQVDHQAFRPSQPNTVHQQQQQHQQPTVEQINQLNLLRSQQQQINQLNRQIANQQSISQQYNHQLYLQQQKQQQQQQQQQQQAKTAHQRPSQFSHPNQLPSTTSQPKQTTVSYQKKYSQQYSQSPSTTPTATEQTPTSTTEDPVQIKEKEKKFKDNLAALPDEVPDDIREQLLASGILGNADISILDYDKVGDIPIENLPPEALENFYGAGSAPVPAVAVPDKVPRQVQNTAAEAKDVEMKVVRYDPSTEEGQKVEDTYIKDDATQVDSVILNDSKYNRYLPLTVSGSNFPLPHASLLAGKKVNSVVVLAPVDYDFVKEQEEQEQREGRSDPVQVQGVRFIAGGSLKNLIKNPTAENYKQWLTKEKTIPSDRQSVVLLVVSPEGSAQVEEKSKEIFMYDIGSETVSRLSGELSNTFVEVAESNAKSQELDGLTDTEAAASQLSPAKVPPPPGFRQSQAVSLQKDIEASEDLAMAASETDENTVYQAPTISSGYSKMAVQ